MDGRQHAVVVTVSGRGASQICGFIVWRRRFGRALDGLSLVFHGPSVSDVGPYSHQINAGDLLLRRAD